MLDRFEYPPLRIEFLEMLREICGLNRDASNELALCKLDLALQHANESRLAGAVGAEHTKSLAGTDIPVEALDKQLVTSLQLTVMHFVNSLAQPCIGEREQLDLVSGRWLCGDQLIRRINAELRLRGSCWCTATQPGELLANQHVAALLGHRCLAHALGLGEHVCAVAAVVLLDPAAYDLPHVLADLIEEPAIMRDDKKTKTRSSLEI